MNTAIQKINTQLNTMSMDGSVLTKNKGAKSLMGIFATLIAVGVSAQPVFATGPTGDSAVKKLTGKAKDWVGDAQTNFMAMATPLAFVCLFIALAIRMMSKNPRTVEEATTWAKRIFTTYLVLALSSFIFKTFRQLRGELDNGNKKATWNEDIGAEN